MSSGHIRYRLGARLSGPFSPGSDVSVRVYDSALDCVVFFGLPSFPAGEVRYGGTGFLILFEEESVRFPYLVTCRHVAEKLDVDFVIRANLRGGGSQPIPISKIDWQYHSDKSVDLAVCYFSLDADRYESGYFDITNNSIGEWSMECCGDPVSIVGLFRLHMGAKKNFPIVHTGHIAALPDKDERIPVIDRATGKISKVLGYLVEVQTLEGLSGSPAFVRDIVRVPQDLPSGFETVSHRLTAEAYGEISLLGIYQGSWDGRPGEILAADRNLNDDKFRVPIGMGIVIPAAKIFEVLDMPKLKKMRKKVIDQKERNRAATTDDGFSAPPASDANPKHREDFNSLLTAAVRKPERED